MNKAYLLLPALVLAGCQSQRLAFGPMPPPTLAAPVPASPIDSATALVVLRASSVAGLPVAQPLPKQAPARRHRPAPAPAIALSEATVAVAPVVPARPRLLQRLALRQMATAGPAHTTESGLGRTVLFILAVVLALVAGLAALFALIPGVSFWGGLGLAVGALVVIGLLFKLLSGGKKPIKTTTK